MSEDLPKAINCFNYYDRITSFSGVDYIISCNPNYEHSKRDFNDQSNKFKIRMYYFITVYNCETDEIVFKNKEYLTSSAITDSNEQEKVCLSLVDEGKLHCY